MSLRIAILGLVGLAIVGGVMFWGLGPRASEASREPPPARAATRLSPPAPGAPVEARPSSAPASASAPAPEAGVPGGRDEAEAALQRRLEAAKQVISVPASGRPPAPGRARSGGRAPTLPPEVEAQRQVALTGWRSAAQALLSECVARPEQARQPLAMEVSFAPAPRAEGEARQVFTPEWIAVPPPELQRLWKDTDPDTLQGCLDRARALTFEVSLPSGSSDHDVPVFAESVSIRL